MSPLTYHLYAAFFDAARALPPWQYIRISGDEAGEAYRAWAAHHGIEVVEKSMAHTRDDGRQVTWTTLESPGLSVGVHLNEQPDASASEAAPEQPIEPEIAF